MYRPLADEIRPQTLDEVVGQSHILGPDGMLRRIVESGSIPNMIFYGPSGTGKTTVARIIAQQTNRTLRKLNATTAGSADAKPNFYLMLTEAFRKDGKPNFVVGTVEEEPGYAPVLAAAKERKPKCIRLLPFMVVAGDHALNDMAGEGEDSWAGMLRKEGYAVDCILKGMGEYPQVRAMYIAKARQAEQE